MKTENQVRAKCAFRRLPATCGLLLWLFMMFSPQSARADHAAAGVDIVAGNSSYFSGSYAAAEQSYARAITDDPAWALPYNNRGLARYHQGNFTGADADFDVAKSMDASYISPYVNKGKSLVAQKKFTEAVAELQAGIVKAPTNKSLHFNLAWAYDEQGNYADAITEYGAALAADPTYYRAQAGRGVSKAKQGDASGAIADLYASINGLSQGDLLAVVASYDLTLLRGPGLNFDSSQAATSFQQGIFQFETQQYTSGAASLRAAQEAERDVADVPWLLCLTRLELRQDDLAKAAFEQAYSMMTPVACRGILQDPNLYLNGILQGQTPAAVRLFGSRYDLVSCNIQSFG